MQKTRIRVPRSPAPNQQTKKAGRTHHPAPRRVLPQPMPKEANAAAKGSTNDIKNSGKKKQNSKPPTNKRN
jgi:hypothetical protein